MKKNLLSFIFLFELVSLSNAQIQPQFIKKLSDPGDFVELNGQTLFKCYGSDIGIWKTDGTANGTVQVKPLVNIVSAFYKMGGNLFFIANDGVNGEELWKTDGTTAGTVMVKDINPTGNMTPSINFMVVGNNTLFFTADDGVHGRELWKSDGTEAGTVLVKDIYPGTQGAEPQFGIFFNG